ncbi:hypothetical protein ACUV84_008426 [Puccinellia chinampoensis]
MYHSFDTVRRGGVERQLRAVAAEKTNNHILEVGIKTSLEFATREEVGRQLMKVERYAQIVLFAQRAATDNGARSFRTDMVAFHRRRVEAAF